MIYLAVASIQQLPVIGLVQFHLMDIIRTTIKTATGSCQGVFFSLQCEVCEPDVSQLTSAPCSKLMDWLMLFTNRCSRCAFIRPGDLRIIDHWALVEEWAARAAAKGRGSPEMDGTN